MKIAIVTMSYRGDYKECRLLCESIDRFITNIPHYLFINDEDVKLFKSLESRNRTILPKSVVLPQYLIRLPFQIMGHHFHVSPFTIPVREWIYQQIVKLSVWEVLDSSIDVFLNVDSECVFLKPFDTNNYLRDGRLRLLRRHNPSSPSRMEYFRAAKRHLGIEMPIAQISYWDFMDDPIGFRRDVLQEMCREIGRRHWSGNYKIALMNTYRFSENYLYGMYVNYIYDTDMKKHFITDHKIFPWIRYTDYLSLEDCDSEINAVIAKEMGIKFQKEGQRNRNKKSPVAFSDVKQLVYTYWGNKTDDQKKPDTFG